MWGGELNAPSKPNYTGYVSQAHFPADAYQNAELVRIHTVGVGDTWSFEYRLTYADGTIVYERDARTYSGMITSCSNSGGQGVIFENDTNHLSTVECTKTLLNSDEYYIVRRTVVEGSTSDLVVEAKIGAAQMYISIPRNARLGLINYDWKSYFTGMKSIDLNSLPYQTIQYKPNLT